MSIMMIWPTAIQNAGVMNYAMEIPSKDVAGALRARSGQRV